MVPIRLFLLVCLVLSGNAFAASLTATVDRQETTIDQPIVFTLSLINSDTRLRAEGIAPNVDLRVLSRDFDLGTPRADNRFRLSPDGGRSISSISVELFPKRPGRYIIPSFRVTGLRSEPITLQIHPAADGITPEVFVRSGLNKSTAWTREQVVAWLDVFHRVDLGAASLGGDLTAAPLRIELMEYRKLPPAERKEQIAGITYNVQRIAWTIFPAQDGALTLRLPDVWAVTAGGRRLRLPGARHPLRIKPLPPGIAQDVLVGKPEISQTRLVALPDTRSLTSWAITVRAPSSITALPGTLPGIAAPTGIELHQDSARTHLDESADGVIANATYTLSVTPHAAGQFQMPAVRLPYFDPQRGAMDIAESPGQTLTVKSGPSLATPRAAAPPAASGASGASTRQTTAVPPWQITTALLAILLSLSMLALWQRARRKVKPSRQTRQAKTMAKPQPGHPLQIMLLEALGSRSLEEGLNAWEARFGVDQEVRDTVRAVQQLYYGEKKGDEETLLPQVQTVAAKIRASASSRKTVMDKWSPQAFTPRL
ncbi:MAG: BatD family protein [Gammaproteobacteria bacterium]|nr:BatD family protein [Gammaproteobacteria bacterium]